MATDAEAPRARDAEIPLANIRSAPKPALARPPPTRQAVRKGRVNFLYFASRLALRRRGAVMAVLSPDPVVRLRRLAQAMPVLGAAAR